MSVLSISIFGNKSFLEIINEIKLFSKFKVKYYEDLDLCVKDAVKQNLLVIFFVSENNKSFFNENKISYFPSILISKSSILKGIFSNGFSERLRVPFSILEFEKRVISLIAKNEFKVIAVLSDVSEMTAAFVIPEVSDVLPQTVNLKKIGSSRDVWFCRYSLSTPPSKGQKLIVSIVGKDTRNQNIPPSTNVFEF